MADGSDLVAQTLVEYTARLHRAADRIAGSTALRARVGATVCGLPLHELRPPDRAAMAAFRAAASRVARAVCASVCDAEHACPAQVAAFRRMTRDLADVLLEIRCEMQIACGRTPWVARAHAVAAHQAHTLVLAVGVLLVVVVALAAGWGASRRAMASKR